MSVQMVLEMGSIITLNTPSDSWKVLVELCENRLIEEEKKNA